MIEQVPVPDDWIWTGPPGVTGNRYAYPRVPVLCISPPARGIEIIKYPLSNNFPLASNSSSLLGYWRAGRYKQSSHELTQCSCY